MSELIIASSGLTMFSCIFGNSTLLQSGMARFIVSSSLDSTISTLMNILADFSIISHLARLPSKYFEVRKLTFSENLKARSMFMAAKWS